MKDSARCVSFSRAADDRSRLHSNPRPLLLLLLPGIHRKRNGQSVRKTGQQLLDEHLQRAEYAKRTSLFLAELNAIHPFREGKGRAQLAYLTLPSAHVGFRLCHNSFAPMKFLEAMIASFQGDITLL
jgi:fido (protein-threonine AMPylation protein)